MIFFEKIMPINGSYPYSGLSYIDTNVINGQTYYYVIKAVDYSGNESSASVQVSDTPDTLDDPPLAPANLSITEKDTELLLTWSPNYEDDLVGYNVYRGTTSGSYTLIAQIGIYEWYVDQNVLAGQTYYYVVTAEDEGGNESGYSNEISGMIGEGDIWIISPTFSNPAVLNFLQYQSTSVEGSVPITTQVSGPRVPIKYDYNIAALLVSEIYLEITNHETGELVYKISEWRPWKDSVFIWNGRYNLGSKQGECVPDDWYGSRIYLKVFDYFDIYKDAVEPRNVLITGCNVSKFDVSFQENTSQNYGFDDYTIINGPWKSVKTGGSTDTALVSIMPIDNYSKIYFTSTNPENITVSPNQASSSSQAITLTGIQYADSEIQANVGNANGPAAAKMNVKAYNEITKRVAIIHVNEDDFTNPDFDDLYPALEDYLRKAYNQAVINLDLTYGATCTVNYDLNGDGKLDVTSGGIDGDWLTVEMNEIVTNCRNNTYLKNIFIVGDITWEGVGGLMDPDADNGFVSLKNTGKESRFYIVAHELGHGFGLRHPRDDAQAWHPPEAASDLNNLMNDYLYYNPWRLRKWQWDRLRITLKE